MKDHPDKNKDRASRLPEVFYDLEAVFSSARELEQELAEERATIMSIEEAHRLELKKVHAQMQELYGKLDQEKRQVEALRQEKSVFQEIRLKLESENRSLQEQMQRAQSELARAGRELALERQRMESEVARLNQDQRRIIAEASGFQQEMQRMNLELARTSQERIRTEGEVTRIAQERQRLEARVTELQSQLFEEQARQHAGIRRAEEEFRKREREQARELDRTMDALRAAEKNAEKQQAERNQFQQQRLQLQQQLKETALRFQQVSAELKTAKEQAAAAQAGSAEAKARLQALESEWSEKVGVEAANSRQLRKELESLRSYIKTLEEKVREATTQLELLDSDQMVPKSRADELEVELRRMLKELDAEKDRTRRLRNETSELSKLCDRLRSAGKDAEAKLLRMETELEAAREKQSQ